MNRSSRNRRPAATTANGLLTVSVRLRSEIPGLVLPPEVRSYSLTPRLPWIPQLGMHGIAVQAGEHCIRRAGIRRTTFSLDEPVRNFQESFTRQNIKSFVGILCLKSLPVGRRGRTVPRSSTAARVSARNQTIVVRHQNGIGPRSIPTSRTNIRIQNTATRVRVAHPMDEESRRLFPRITDTLSRCQTRQAQTGGTSAAAAEAAVRAIPSVQVRPPNLPPVVRVQTAAMNGHRPELQTNIYREDDTQDGDLDGMDEKNICIAHIERHWNNKDMLQVLTDLRELRINDKFRAFSRLLHFTSNFLESYVHTRGPVNLPDPAATGQAMNNLDEDNGTQDGDADGVEEKTAWINHIREHWSNRDVLQIRDELATLLRKDKYRTFIRLIPFSSGFIKETFHDILQPQLSN